MRCPSRLVSAVLSLCLAGQPLLASAAQYQYQIPMVGPDLSAASSGRLTLSPSSHDFGTVVLGSTAVTSTTIKNSGQDSVRLTGISIDGPFSQSNSCPAVLVGGQSCQAAILFNASGAGSYSSALEVSAQESGASVSFPVSGSAVVPTTNLSVSPTSLDFGASNVSTTAAIKTLTITNDGNSPATVSGISVSDGATDFSQSNTCAAILAPGASCSVNVAFTPAAFGVRTGGLSVYEEASGTLYSTALQGMGSAAVLAVSPSSLALLDTIIGYPSTAKVTVTNAGNMPLQAVDTNIIGDAEFSIADSQCGASLAPSVSCDVTLSFAPAGAGPKSATLTVTSSNGGTKVVAISGQAVAQAPALTATPGSLTHSAAEVGTTAPVQSVTLTNNGNIPVTVSGLGVVLGASDFAQANDCATVPVHGSCTVNVQFTPAARGARSGTVYLHYANLDLTIPLSGQGLQGVASLSAPSVDFGSVQVAQAATGQVLTVSNAGDAPLAINSVTVPVSDFSASSGCTTLAPGASCAVNVGFTPSVLGTRAQSLSVVTDAGTTTMPLHGVGVKGNASVSSSSVSFAAQQVASTSSVQAVTVSNIGTSPLAVSGVSVISGASDFAQANNCATLPVNGSCTINVSFTPSAVGTQTGTLAMTHNGDGVTTVALSGTGQAQSATLSVGSFASTHVSATSDATAVLANTGIGALSVTVPAAGSVTGTDFNFVSTTCGAAVAVGASCNVVVRFAPTSTAARTGSVSVSTGAGVKSQSLSSTGVQGTSSLSASSLTFAAQQVASTSGVQTVTVTNTGTSPLAFSGISVVSGVSDFAQSNNCATVAVNGSCTINVSFTPSTTGARTGTIALTHDGAGVSTISVSGTGQTQTASLSTPVFAATPVGSSSNATATLANTGIGALSVTVPSAASVSGTDFSFVSTTCGTSVAVGSNCTVTVKFTATGTTARSGTLSIGTGAGTQSVSLGSTGIQGYASVSPGSLTFATRQNGTTSAAQTVTVTNTGTNTLTFTGVGISTGGTDFAQSNNCGAVAVNGTCTVNVTFTPAAAGARTGTLSFVHDGGGIANVSLSGTGQAASATITSGSWGNQQVSTTNASGYQVITNTGIGPVSLTGTPSVNAPFTYLSNNCPSPIAAGGNCSVFLSFTPTAAQSYTQTLTVPTSAGTLTSTSTGTGVAASLVAISGSSAGTSLPPQTTSGTYFTFQNNGIGPVTLSANPTSSGSLLVSTTTSAGWCYSGLVMAAGTFCQVYGYFTGAAGSYSGTLSVTSNAPTVSQTITGTVVGNLSVASAAFGGVTVGSTKDMTVAVTNSASVTARSMTYAATAPFSIVTNGCAATLAANSSCNLTVRYSPAGQTATSGNYVTVTGQFDRTVAGSADSANLGAVITSSGAMSGNGTYAALVFSPTSLSFGSVQVGQSSTQAVTITNPGNVAATGLGGSVPAGYTVASVSPNPCGASLAAGATCNLNVTFTPTTAQSYSGTFTVPGTNIVTASLPLSGTGANPSLVLSGWNTGGNAALGTVGYNSDSGRWPIYTNTGSGPVVIQGHTSTGAFWAWQGTSGYCYPGLTVAAGASCVFFNGVGGTGVGDYSGSSTVTYTAAGQSTVFSTGVPNYTASIRTATSNVGSIAFGTVPQNQWNGPQTVTITNNATNNPLQNIAINFSGGNSGNFTTSGNTCGATLAGGASCSVSVYFNPTWSANGFGTTLVVTGGYPRMEPGDSGYIPSNSSVNIQIPVSGNAAYSQATLTSASSIALADWYQAGAITGDFVYRNDGNSAMTLANPAVSSPLSINLNNCSGISPGASCTIRIALTRNAGTLLNQTQSFTASGATIAPSATTVSWSIYTAVPRWNSTAIAFGTWSYSGGGSTATNRLYNDGNVTYNWAANNGISSQIATTFTSITNTYTTGQATSNTFSLDFSQCSSVAPGSYCDVPIHFQPTRTGWTFTVNNIVLNAASWTPNVLGVGGKSSTF